MLNAGKHSVRFIFRLQSLRDSISAQKDAYKIVVINAGMPIVLYL